MDRVGSLVVSGEVQCVVDGLAESSVSDCFVVVHIFSIIFIVFVEVDSPGVCVLGCWLFNQVVVEFVIFVVVDGVQSRFGQRAHIDLAVFIQLVSNFVGVDHFNGYGVEQSSFSIPVVWVFGEDFFVAVYEGGHGVATVVPVVGVIHSHYAFNAQFIDHALWHWVQTSPCWEGWEVWFWIWAVVNQSQFVWAFNTNHFHEFGTFRSIQSPSISFRQFFGVSQVISSTSNHVRWLRGMSGFVFVVVHYPFKSYCPVMGGNIAFDVAVHVYPFNTFTQVEGPGQTIVVGFPGFSDCRNNVTFGINFYERVDHVGQVFEVRVAGGVQNVEGFQLTGSQTADYQVGNWFSFWSSWSGWGSWGCRSGSFWSAWSSWSLCRSLGGTASRQSHSSSKSQCQHFSQFFGHSKFLLIK